MEGLIEKFAPLALVPIFDPPVETVYHLIVFPAEVALRLVEVPWQIVDGVAVTDVGAAGTAFTVTVTAVRVELTHPDPLSASA